MNEFDAAKHARETRSGRFATMVHAEGKPLAPLRGTLAGINPYYVRHMKDRLLFAASGGSYHGVVDTVIPPSGAAAAKSMRNPRGLKDGRIREVALNRNNAPDTPADVTGPKDGRPLAIQVTAHAPAHTLNVTSGKAIIAAESEYGTTVRVAAGAEAVIIAAAHRRVSVDVEEGARVTLMSNSAANGFTVTGWEAGITRDFPAPEKAAAPDDTDEDRDDDNKCTRCGEPSDNGEGYDGLCGNCADLAQPACAECGDEIGEGQDGLCEDCAENSMVAEMSVKDENGEDAFYIINRIGDGHYELEADGDAVVEFHFNGDNEAHGEIQSAGVRALREIGTFVYEDGEEPEKLGGYDVPQKSLTEARELESVLDGVPDWSRTDTIAEWARAKGYDYSQFTDARTADISHGRGTIVADWDDVGVGTEGHFGRNSWISLEGEGATFPDGEDYEDGWPGAMTVIYPREL